MAYLYIIKDPSKALTLTKRGGCACYRFNTIREYLHDEHWKCHDESSRDAKIRRWRFGEDNRDKVNKTILLVGETGSGKTTLLNTIINHMIGVKFEDKVWFEITEEEGENQYICQTSAVTVYEVHVETLQTSLTIIDTPGYGDTRGADHDKTIADHLGELIESYVGIDRIDAVGLVVKASQNQLADIQRCINSVLSFFGRDMKDNIVILITHSDGLPPTNALNSIKNAKIKCATEVDGEPVHFLFNNRQCEPHEENQAKHYKRFWSLGDESTEGFFEFIQRVTEKSLKMTGNVLKKRIQLEACLRDLTANINKVSEEENELKKMNDIVINDKAKLDNNERFTFKTRETKMKKVPIKYHFALCDEEATCCDVCEKNCHFPGCTFVDNLYWCTVMSQGKCTVCGCSYNKHTKENKLYMPVTEEDMKTNEDLKREYQDVLEKNVGLQHNIDGKLTEKRQQISQLLENAYKVIIDLDKIALHQEYLNTYVDFDVLITKLSENNQHDKAQKLKEIKDRAQADKDPKEFGGKSVLNL
ncbi:uncharacterized protein LOC134060342 isoform X2 [Sardina pilchardus]